MAIKASDLIEVEDGSASATANSYADPTVDGDPYFASRLYADTWTNATAEEKAKALMMATRVIDNACDWDGEPRTLHQALRWPRYGTYNPDGFLYDSNIIPQQLIEATCELAMQLLQKDRTADYETAGYSQIGVAGGVTVNVNPSDRPGVLPRAVLDMIDNLIAGGASGVVQKAVRSG